MNHEENAGAIRRRRGRPRKNDSILYAGGSVEEEQRQEQIAYEHDVLNVIQETFPNLLDGLLPNVPEVSKDIYYHVLDLVATTADGETLRWQITQDIFEYALVQMDAERRGIAMTYAALMPARTDGIHSLYEVIMRGTEPWPFSIEGQAYLGSTTLAGTAAVKQRVLTWNTLDEAVRAQFDVDEYEKSACACPVTRAGRIAGVLIISSTQPYFFANEIACQSVVEYAHLLAQAFHDNEFYPYSLLNLRPMPPLKEQREEVRETLMDRIMSFARSEGFSRAKAVVQVRGILEHEFEMRAQSQRG